MFMQFSFSKGEVGTPPPPFCGPATELATARDVTCRRARNIDPMFFNVGTVSTTLAQHQASIG